MVPHEHRQQYEVLLAALEQLRLSVLPEAREDRGRASGTEPQMAAAEAASPSPIPVGITSADSSVDAFREGVTAITQQFQQILGLGLAEVDEAIALRLQSIQTEISKQLRLLAMDTMFLKTARQPETNQQRRQQIGDRLNLLERYCEAILATDGAVDPEARSAELE